MILTTLWRLESEIPMLGFHFCYALRDSDFVIANNQDFLNAVLATRNPRAMLNQSGSSFDNVTVIRLDQRKPAFDAIGGKLEIETKLGAGTVVKCYIPLGEAGTV